MIERSIVIFSFMESIAKKCVLFPGYFISEVEVDVKIIFIYGDPGVGKSYLANLINKNYNYKILSIDNLYLDFIKTKYESFFFENLNNYISEHYEKIMVGEYTKRKHGINFENDWKDYLINEIYNQIKTSKKLVVEGYLLTNCVNFLETTLIGCAKTMVVRSTKYGHLLETPIDLDNLDTIFSCSQR